MNLGPSDTKKELQFPADIFSKEDLHQRRATLYEDDVRSRLVLHPETEDTVAYYDLTLVGPAKKMSLVGLMFSYFDDTEFFNPLNKKRPHKMG